MGIQEQLRYIKEQIPSGVRLVAVSKTHPAEAVEEAYKAGHRIFGENKAQELMQKQPLLPADIEWHFIGHLQSNKVKFIVPFISMVESVDSLKLLKEIDKHAVKAGRRVDCLLQFHIASEETKFGLDLEEARELLSSDIFKSMKNVRICGVMGMASLTEDEDILHKEFTALRKYFHSLKEEFFRNDGSFREISMGMSGDYPVAIQEGSTNIRLGTAIFGERDYTY